MNILRSAYPEREQVWRGAILGSIAHAIAVARFPDMSNEQSWDAGNYSVQDSMGSRGTLSFGERTLVGVFFDPKSPRSPFASRNAPRAHTKYDLELFFREISPTLRTFASQEALQYLLQDLEGDPRPVITAAFWSSGDAVMAAEPWADVLANGAHLVRNQLLADEEAIAAWREEYEMNDDEVLLLRSVFARKIAAPNRALALSAADVAVIEARVDADGDGLEQSHESFAEMEIDLPLP